MQSDSEKNLYQADIQFVSLLKDMRENVHNICKEHVEKKVRIEAIDGQVFEGVIVDYDDQNVYVEVVDQDAEEEDFEEYDYENYEDYNPYQVMEVANRQPYGGWGQYPDYYFQYVNYNPYAGYPPYGDLSPFGGNPYYSPYGDEYNPYSQVSPFGSSNNSRVSPYSSSNRPAPQVSPYSSSNRPAPQVSPYSEQKPQVSPWEQNLSPFPPFPPYPPFFCPPPPPPPPPYVLPKVQGRRRRKRCRNGRKIIPLALFTLLTIVLI